MARNTSLKNTGTPFDIAVIGLGVMGQGLAVNIARNGYRVAGFDVNVAQARGFADRLESGDSEIGVFDTLLETLESLRSPTQIFVMVPAGSAVDDILELLVPHCGDGDIIIDCGNSHFNDTSRRQKSLTNHGIAMVGMGVSGGQKGVLYGPSMMPGGDAKAVETVLPLLEKIAAKNESDDAPCVAYMGAGSAGHFVKMVHNGIEYGEMQLIAETYDFMRRGLGMSAVQIGSVFNGWNAGEQGSFLIGISGQALLKTDDETGRPLVEMILDSAGQKGTGRWTSQAALDLGIGVPTITAAVDARIMSSRKAERVAASETVNCSPISNCDTEQVLSQLEATLFAGRIIAYAQGFNLLAAASSEYSYGLDLAQIARIWRAGCILRSPFLEVLAHVFDDDAGVSDLLLAPKIAPMLPPCCRLLSLIAAMFSSLPPLTPSPHPQPPAP